MFWTDSLCLPALLPVPNQCQHHLLAEVTAALYYDIACMTEPHRVTMSLAGVQVPGAPNHQGGAILPLLCRLPPCHLPRLPPGYCVSFLSPDPLATAPLFPLQICQTGTKLERLWSVMPCSSHVVLILTAVT